MHLAPNPKQPFRTREHLRRWGIAGFACLAVMGLAGYGLTKIETSVQLMRMFSPGTRILEDYAWLEKNVGELVPMEIVLRFDKDQCDLNMAQKLALIRQVQDEITKHPKGGSAMSGATFTPKKLKPPPKSALTRPFLRDADRTQEDVYNRRLEKARSNYDVAHRWVTYAIVDLLTVLPEDFLPLTGLQDRLVTTELPVDPGPISVDAATPARLWTRRTP